MEQTTNIARGAVMLDITGASLTDEDRKRLSHPNVGGVILFRRNFISIKQLKDLISEIKSLRTPHLIVAVDHEGGRVQRFLEGFTRIPAMRRLGQIADEKGLPFAQDLAQKTGYVLATELRACDIDLSFTPVLDLDYGCCDVIGDRSFHHDANTVAILAESLHLGLRRGGMASCGKHFPGHGAVTGDSHLELPYDSRTRMEMNGDLIPFRRLIASGMAAVMPAHVLYKRIDKNPAGFSSYWLQKVLRNELGFDGIIFSDDLTMEGACGVGNINERTTAALNAGCDVALVCNRIDLADELIHTMMPFTNYELARRWKLVEGQGSAEYFSQLILQDEFQKIAKEVEIE